MTNVNEWWLNPKNHTDREDFYMSAGKLPTRVFFDDLGYTAVNDL